MDRRPGRTVARARVARVVLAPAAIVRQATAAHAPAVVAIAARAAAAAIADQAG